MKEYIYVNTGEVKSGGPDLVYNSGAIGSCVVITAFDQYNNVGGMAHVMLPGRASLKEDKPRTLKGLENLKIIIAEDDEISYNHLSIILRTVSTKILHANNGPDVIKLFQDNPDTDLILMDIKMPGLDGFETTKRIRENDKDVIIIAQTAYALASDRENSFKAGCNAYVSKPINKGELLNIIKKNLYPTH